MAINIKPMNSLCDELWNLCNRLAASSDEQVKEWTDHPEIYLRLQRKYVDSLPEHLKKDVLDAIAIWDEIEVSFLLKIKKSRGDFIDDFVNILNAFIDNDETWKLGAQRYGNSCRGVVWNIDWVDAFVWQLPAADPDNDLEYLRIGQMMSAIFFLEILAKEQDLSALYPQKQHMVSEIRNVLARVVLVFANYLLRRSDIDGKRIKNLKGDYTFWDAIVIPPETPPRSIKIILSFRPIVALFGKYLIISVIMDRGEKLRSEDLRVYDSDVDEISNKWYVIIKELPVYEAVYSIMINDIDRFIRVTKNSRIDINYQLNKTAVFSKPYNQSVTGFTFLTIAATIGRYHFVKYLIEHGADISKHIFESGPGHTPLSVNECMIMNALFRWFKSGMGKKLTESEMKELIDLIILASQKEPLIVSDESIHPDETIVRRTIYWENLGKAAGIMDFVKGLMQLNPSAIKALYES